MVHASAIWILFMKHETLFSLIMRKTFSYSSCASSSISSYLSLLNITHISLPPQHHTHTTHTHTHHTPPHTTPNTDYSDIFPIICFRLFYSLLHLFSEDCYIFHCTVSFGIGTINDWSSDKGKSPILSR